MGMLEYAIDELRATGWSTLDTAGCSYTPAGSMYPNLERTHREFGELSHTLTITRIELFDCFRAAWSDSNGSPVGAVVGQSEAEAAVYALAQLRRAASRAMSR